MKDTSITTRRGDDGTTGLLDDRRVLKSDSRPEAYGALDETAAFIGLARAHGETSEINDLLLLLQNHIYLINAELACPPESSDLLKRRLQTEDLNKVEAAVRSFEEKLQLPPRFVLYGATKSSAFLDVARAVSRRGERRAIELHQREPLQNPVILPYLNRLSDVLYLLARYAEKLQKVSPRHPET